MRKFRLIFFLVFFLLSFHEAQSQCSMCRRVAETSNTQETNPRKGLNKGILYLLSVPYILGGIGLFAWYRSKRRS